MAHFLYQTFVTSKVQAILSYMLAFIFELNNFWGVEIYLYDEMFTLSK